MYEEVVIHMMATTNELKERAKAEDSAVNALAKA